MQSCELERRSPDFRQVVESGVVTPEVVLSPLGRRLKLGKPFWTISGLVILGLLLASALATVYVSHENRQLFIELQSLRQAQDAQQAEWGRLLLEKGAWSASGRVEQAARETLGMTVPTSDNIVLILR